MNVIRPEIAEIAVPGSSGPAAASPAVFAPGLAPRRRLRRALRDVWAHRWGLFCFVAVVTMTAALISQHITPRFRAVATLVVNPDPGTGGADLSSQILESEIEIMRSDAVQRGVRNGPLPASAPSGVFRDTYGVRHGLIAQLPMKYRDSVEAIRPRGRDAARTLLPGSADEIQVERQNDSRVIQIVATSTDPDRAAALANGVADGYFRVQVEAALGAARPGAAWLEAETRRLRDVATTAEKEVFEFRRTAGALDSQAEVAANDIPAIDRELEGMTAALADLAAERQLLADLRDRDQAAARIVSAIVRPDMAQLGTERSKAIEAIRDLDEVYGRKHPTMIAARDKLAEIDVLIVGTADAILETMARDIAALKGRLMALDQRKANVEVRHGENEAARFRLQALTREAEMQRARYEEFSKKAEAFATDARAQGPSARIVSRAAAPAEAAWPNSTFVVGAAASGAMGLGIFVLMAASLLRPGFRSGEEIENELGLPAIGLIPETKRRFGFARRFEDRLLKDPGGAAGESVRSLLTALLMTRPSQPVSLVVTSAMPDEGKSTLALALARYAAKCLGKKTLLIDGDLKNPNIGRRVGLKPAQGLAECLAGRIDIGEAIRTEHDSGLKVMTAGGRNALAGEDPAERFGDVLRNLEGDYDLIVIDAPPVVAVSDAQVMARLADATLLVARWDRTPRKRIQAALQLLRRAGAQVAGVALNRVNVRRHARFGYGDSGVYAGAYRKYYAR